MSIFYSGNNAGQNRAYLRRRARSRAYARLQPDAQSKTEYVIEQITEPVFNADATKARTDAYVEETRTVMVSLPGGIVPVPLVFGSPQTFAYNPDTFEAVVSEAGRYRLGFFLAVDSLKEAQCAFIVRVNGRKLPGGVFYAALKKGRQDWSESLDAVLREGDTVGLAFSSASPMAINISGKDSPEFLMEKLAAQV